MTLKPITQIDDFVAKSVNNNDSHVVRLCTFVSERMKTMKVVAVMCWILAVSGMSSCSVDNTDNPTTAPEPQSEYTILFYGAGGANLDRYFFSCMDQFCRAAPDAYKHVNIVV